MAKKRIAICPKCEKRFEIGNKTAEAWCQHAKGWEKGNLVPKDKDDVLEVIQCKIITVDDKN